MFVSYNKGRTFVRKSILTGGTGMKYRRCTGKRALYTVLFAAAVMYLSCLFGKNLAMANEESRSKAYNRYYTNIEIKEGDTLWSIASQYSKNSGMSIQEYIREIKAMNHKGSDRINAGDSLAIVYFREAGPKT